MYLLQHEEGLWFGEGEFLHKACITDNSPYSTIHYGDLMAEGAKEVYQRFISKGTECLFDLLERRDVIFNEDYRLIVGRPHPFDEEDVVTLQLEVVLYIAGSFLELSQAILCSRPVVVFEQDLRGAVEGGEVVLDVLPILDHEGSHPMAAGHVPLILQRLDRFPDGIPADPDPGRELLFRRKFLHEGEVFIDDLQQCFAYLGMESSSNNIHRHLFSDGASIARFFSRVKKVVVQSSYLLTDGFLCRSLVVATAKSSYG